MKSEPSVYGIDDLGRAPRKVTAWTGIRNYQARNFMRDQMRPGDRSFFYHSNCEQPGIVGLLEVCSGAYPDPTQFDRKSKYYDSRSKRNNPVWMCVDVKLLKSTRLVSLAELRSRPELKDMRVLARGNRLSITPVDPAEWETVIRMV